MSLETKDSKPLGGPLCGVAVGVRTTPLTMSFKARLYVLTTSLMGAAVLVYATVNWECKEPVRFACYFLIAALASGFKVRLPGILGTMSVNFFFVLVCLSTLTLPETLAITCSGTILQCVWRSKTPARPVKIIFNVASVATAIACAHAGFTWPLIAHFKEPIRLILAACVYFVANTFPVSIIVALTEGKQITKTWRECYFWSFPYYVFGAALAELLSVVNHVAGWETSLMIFPVMYWMYRSYRLYLSRLEDEKKHVEEMAGLHLRTIEALALAIEAKDNTTHSHLRRVGLYAAEIGKEFGLSDSEMRALRAAALLHDIGKLAVPEHIISKPGKLTPAEFEKMKIHPVIGAEILRQVDFPYPVVPIVRSHHEKWDGSGYPDGLRGEEIPVGARILSVVDCLDALASDRQYRRAMPLDEAIAKVTSEAGKSFDPRIVEVLRRRYRELETLVLAEPARPSRLPKNLKIAKGDAPATGLASNNTVAGSAIAGPDFLSSIAAAHQEAQTLFELTHALGTSLNLDETLSVVALRLKRIVSYDCIAVYTRHDTKLVPEYVSGENAQLFMSLEIPVGEGLSGWVADNRKPIVNGNPSVEPGYLNDPAKFSILHSALAVPLEGVDGLVGVLTLYHAAKEAYNSDHLRILSAVATKMALSIENALKYRQAESCATTDALTSLPNARSLFIHLENEVARSKREGLPLTILVCDLDGFKGVNDRFGHLEGNRVLREVAQGLMDNCREYDYVSRMGGDEFVVVLPGHKPDTVAAKIQRLQDVALLAGRRLFGEDLLSMSVGEASYPADGTDAEHLLAEADRRMYKTKQQNSLMRGQLQAFEMVRLSTRVSGAEPDPTSLSRA
jgi:diguanylate cyclase (GGDEF)-like protein/putative nucleotidyltransferase with HDIG domain